MGTGTRESKAANRQLILTTAAAMFKEDGLAAGVRDIAKKAGRSLGSVYEFWETKGDLIEELSKTDPEIRKLRVEGALVEIAAVARLSAAHDAMLALSVAMAEAVL